MRAAQRRSPTDARLRKDVRALVETVRMLIGGERVPESSGSNVHVAASGSGNRPGVITIGDVTVDLRAHTVVRRGADVALSPRGFAGTSSQCARVAAGSTRIGKRTVRWWCATCVDGRMNRMRNQHAQRSRSHRSRRRIARQAGS